MKYDFDKKDVPCTKFFLMGLPENPKPSSQNTEGASSWQKIQSRGRFGGCNDRMEPNLKKLCLLMVEMDVLLSHTQGDL